MQLKEHTSEGTIGEVICITGMHRSGTSLFANWLGRSGVNLDFGAYVPPAHWNPQGHFENESLVKLHSSAIHRIMANSKGWKVKKCGALSFTDDEISMATQISKLLREHACSGWKDPRALFFLAEWKKMLPNFKTIIIYRSATKVIPSLLLRYSRTPKIDVDTRTLLKISFFESLLCYRAHIDTAIAYKRCHPKITMILPIDSFLENNLLYFDKIDDFVDSKIVNPGIQRVFDNNIFGRSAMSMPFFYRNILAGFSRYYDMKVASLLCCSKTQH